MTIEIENFDDLIKNPTALKEAIAKKFEQEKSTFIQSYDIENDERVRGLKTNRDEILTKYKKFEGVDVEEYKRLKEEAGKSLKNTDVDGYLEQEKTRIKTEYERVLEEKNNELKTIQEERNNMVEERKQNKIINEFSKLAQSSDSKLKDVSFSKEASLIKSMFTVNEAGEIVEKSGKLNTKTGKAYTLSDYVTDLKTNEAHLFEVLRAGTANGKKTTAQGAMRKLTLAESIEMSKNNPDLYARHKKLGLAFIN